MRDSNGSATRKTASKERIIVSGIAAPAKPAMNGVVEEHRPDGATKLIETNIAPSVEIASRFSTYQEPASRESVLLGRSDVFD